MASFSAAWVSATISCPAPVPRKLWYPVGRNILSPTVQLSLVQCPSSLTQQRWCISPRYKNTKYSLLLHSNQTYTSTLYHSPNSPQMMYLLKQFLISKGPASGPSLSSESVYHHVHWRRCFTSPKSHPGPGQDPYSCCTLSHHSSVQHTSLVNWKLEWFIIAECP